MRSLERARVRLGRRLLRGETQRVNFALVLPSSIRCCVVAWRAGTRAKWRARILRAHIAELRELTASL